PVLLQMHIAEESEKFGFSEEELMRFLDDGVASEKYPNVLFSGMMGMATFTDDEHQIRQEFGNLKLLFDRIRSGFFSENDDFRTLSMGMSGDYSIALACGSTMVRIGSSIFGSR
ncbi:MAG: alanine racemase, partial [Flavobacteriales bacterium]|nr:alanine racemase [Flavobacteriales bacterium]